MPFIADDLEACSRSYLEPLAARPGLRLSPMQSSGSWAAVDAIGETLVVRLEADRGLVGLQIRAKAADHDFKDVEQVADRFPRIRTLAGGTQRLTLEEQARFIETHWRELELIFRE
jgi:hypothetical protein